MLKNPQDFLCREFKKLVDCGAAKLVPDYTGINALRYDSREDFNLDVDFYLRLAGAPCRILELGSGTGRIALPLARAGHKVWALDNSADMHAILKGKLDGSLSGLVTQVQSSMADFEIDGIFDLAILGLDTFFQLTEEAERKNCFAAVRRHLRPGGRFLVDASLPFARDSKALDGRYGFFAESAREGKTVFCVRHTEYYPKRQFSVDSYLYAQISADGGTELFVTPSVEYHPAPGELRLLLEGAGFEIISFDCDYSKTPFTDASARTDMVVLAQAA